MPYWPASATRTQLSANREYGIVARAGVEHPGHLGERHELGGAGGNGRLHVRRPSADDRSGSSGGADSLDEATPADQAGADRIGVVWVRGGGWVGWYEHGGAVVMTPADLSRAEAQPMRCRATS